jgi:hypothetical protein
MVIFHCYVKLPKGNWDFPFEKCDVPVEEASTGHILSEASSRTRLYAKAPLFLGLAATAFAGKSFVLI